MRLRRMDTTVFLLLMVMGCSHGSAGHFNVTKDDESQNTSTSIVKIMPESADLKKITFLTDQLPERAIAYPKIGGSSRCTTCLERTSKYCCKTPKGRCCDYGYEPSKNNSLTRATVPYCHACACARRTKSTVCPGLTNRRACLTSRESRWNSNERGGEIHGVDCAWCRNGPCLSSNGNQRCQVESLLIAKQVKGIETCLTDNAQDCPAPYVNGRGTPIIFTRNVNTNWACRSPCKCMKDDGSAKDRCDSCCARVGNTCGIVSPYNTKDCYDKDEHWCQIRKHLCIHSFKVKTLCKKSCNFCGKCVDQSPDYCWKYKYHCKTDWEVRTTCRRTCGDCD